MCFPSALAFFLADLDSNLPPNQTFNMESATAPLHLPLFATSVSARNMQLTGKFTCTYYGHG